MDEYSLSLPVSNNFESSNGLLYVVNDSDKELRIALELMAKYFKKEMKYDFIQYEANEHIYSKHVPYKGWLFSEIAYDHMQEELDPPTRVIGGCCFRERANNEEQSIWKLDWIWLHPFFRNRGHLEKRWKYLVKEHGGFSIQEPISCVMKQFLKRNT